MNIQRRRSLNVNTCINTFEVEEHRIGQDVAEGDDNLLQRNAHQQRADSTVDSVTTPPAPRTEIIDTHEKQLKEAVDNLLTFIKKEL
jgi:hypothetical protein